MNTVLIDFGGRAKGGNCWDICEYISTLTDGARITNYPVASGRGIAIIKLASLTIHPCAGCGYECFPVKSRCPHYGDDAAGLYTALSKAETIISVIPSYRDNPCSLYFIAQERAQCCFNETNPEDFERYLNIRRKFIVVANSGFDCIARVIRHDFPRTGERDILRLSSRVFGVKSINGGLMTVPEARALVREFIS